MLVLLRFKFNSTTATSGYNYSPFVTLTPMVKKPAEADGFATAGNITLPSAPHRFGPISVGYQQPPAKWTAMPPFEVSR